MPRTPSPYRGEFFAKAVAEDLVLAAEDREASLPKGPFSKTVDDEAQKRWRNDRTPYRSAFAVLALSWFDQVFGWTAGLITSFKEKSKLLVEQLRKQTHDLEKVDRCRHDALAGRYLAEQRLRKEFEHLQKMPKVRAVHINNDELVVETERLIITAFDESQWDIDRWAIHLSRQGRSHNIRCFPLRDSPPRDHAGWYHPHVGPEGSVCWGNAGPTLDAALSGAQYDVVVELVIATLDSGRVYNWNRAEGAHDYGLRLRETAQRIN